MAIEGAKVKLRSGRQLVRGTRMSVNRRQVLSRPFISSNEQRTRSCRGRNRYQ